MTRQPTAAALLNCLGFRVSAFRFSVTSKQLAILEKPGQFFLPKTWLEESHWNSTTTLSAINNINNKSKHTKKKKNNDDDERQRHRHQQHEQSNRKIRITTREPS